MKRGFLLLLICCTAVSAFGQLTANRKIAQRYDEYANNQWEGKDSILFSYNLLGLESIRFAIEGQGATNWAPYYRITSTHDANGNLLTRTRENWFGGVFFNSTKYTYTYNSNNQQTEVLYQVWNTSLNAWGNTGKINYTYNSSNQKQTKLETFTWNNGWQPNTKQDWYYNAADELITKEFYSFTNNSWVGTARYQYQYAFGMISNITESTYLGSNWVLHKQTINLINGSVTPPRLAQVTQYYRDTANVVWDFSSRSVYNYTNNLLSDIQTSNYDTVTNVWRNAGLVSYSYNANNQLTEEVKQVYNLNSSNFENDQRKLLTYNATNLNDKTTFYDNAGPAAWIESGRDNFYYNSNDSLIHLLNEEYIGSSFVPNYQYFYHYADVPVGIHEVNNLFTNATLYPNPCSNVLTIDTKDEIPKTVQAVIYSLNGKKVWSQISTTPDNKLLFDVASLPNGNFVLQLSDLKSSKRHHFKFTKK